MAKQGNVFQSYTPELKEKVIREYLDGDIGMTKLARKHGVASKKNNMYMVK